jgi:hypothetical protein
MMGTLPHTRVMSPCQLVTWEKVTALPRSKKITAACPPMLHVLTVTSVSVCRVCVWCVCVCVCVGACG